MKNLCLMFIVIVFFANAVCAKDNPQTEEALKKAAGFGDPSAQTDLGILYLRPDMREAHGAEAMQWFLRAAASGYASAEFNLGVMYLRGWGTQADSTEAVRWFRKAGRHGIQSANAYMGLILVRSNNPAEQSDGFKAIRDAAKHGDSVAMNALGYCYDIGLGTAPNLNDALKWYKRAASKNDRGAQHNLAKLYRAGYGVPRDAAEAARLEQKACDAGNPFACSEMATAYLEGQGVAQDTAQALRYGLLGNADQQFLSSASQSLSEDRRKQVTAEAERWKQAHLQSFAQPQ
jgi:uncharacterized protein